MNSDGIPFYSSNQGNVYMRPSSYGQPGNNYSGNGYAQIPPGFGDGYPQPNMRMNGMKNHTNGYSYQNGYADEAVNGIVGKNYSNGLSSNIPSNMFVAPSTENGELVNPSESDHHERTLFTTPVTGINFDNYENIPVNVGGENPPSPIANFADASLLPAIQENIVKSGYMRPTPVQKHSIPTLLNNRDLMSCAQTGSGKTAAFLLPIINHILANGPNGIKQQTPAQQGRKCLYPAALVIAPTRELAIQIHKEAMKFSHMTDIVTAILYGGRENYRDQLNKLRGGCHILIATPGRLIDIVDQGFIGLSGCRYLVLDEADRMLDMGFEPQIRKIVEQGQMPDKNNRITAMFSATFPKAIQELAQDFLKTNYVFLAVGRVGSTSDNIDQNALWISEEDKRKALMSILDEEDPSSLVLVFVETKRGANDLAHFLQNQGIRAVAIHGDLKQFDREKNLATFTSGHNTVLVATAVAARGLDIPNVRHVVNFDLPGDIDEYVHRIGRTGRCGNPGKATSFFNDKNRGIARDLSNILTESNKDIPDWLRRAAAEGRPAGRSRGSARGFGANDHRRGRGGGYQHQTFNHGMNGLSNIGTFNPTFPNANGASRGFYGGGRGAYSQQSTNGFSNGGYARGGYNGGYNGYGGPPNHVFNGGMMSSTNVYNGFVPPYAGGSAGPNMRGGFSAPPPSVPQQNGFGNWQQPAQQPRY